MKLGIGFCFDKCALMSRVAIFDFYKFGLRKHEFEFSSCKFWYWKLLLEACSCMYVIMIRAQVAIFDFCKCELSKPLHEFYSCKFLLIELLHQCRSCIFVVRKL